MSELGTAFSPPFVAALIFVLMIAGLAYERRLDFVVRELPDWPSRVAGVGLLTFVLALCVFLPLAAPMPEIEDPADLNFAGLFVAHTLIVVFLVIWWLLAGRISLTEYLLLQEPTADDLRAGISLGAVGWAATIAVTAAAGALLLGEPEALGSSQPAKVMLWLARLPVWQKLIVIFVAMTVEEMFFRGFLQPRIGLAPSTILFTLAHASYGMPLMLLSIFTFSMVLGLFFARSGRLLPCIVAHGVFDAVQLLVVLPWALEMMEHGVK